ncbi:ATP-binding protein [Micromonospora craniellae]|uniref:ATP-binding protein n=1 Tax=Micromonospora craniellae TaxID=2294034 RepID=A0A372FVC8_9ACTN|nr:ATP-binding protein [Micromonospora craniellae]QOC92419.1 ATP-binding protein [Micromonospora craniellae]RFS44584.1 ATP-binding protein [Micromonospora craniellae]
MASRIICEVDDGAPVTVVRLAGTLDLTTTRAAYRVLDRCLAAQPDALVVDLSGLRVDHPLAVSVFAAAARRAAGWPVVPMVLCAPGPAVESLADSGACQVVPMRRSCDEAAQVAGASAVPRLRMRLEPVAAACRRARELVVDACARWNLPEAVGPASVVLSELVGNVVRHAGTPMQVTVTLRRPWLHLAVVDGSSTPARPGESGHRDEGGRGLLLVRELADRWGSAPAGDGKAVWATLPAN